MSDYGLAGDILNNGPPPSSTQWGTQRLSPPPQPVLATEERIEVISVRPDDVVVIRCKGRIHDAHRKHLMDMGGKVFKENEVVVLDGGMAIEVYRRQQDIDETMIVNPHTGHRSKKKICSGCECEIQTSTGSMCARSRGERCVRL